MFDKYIHYSYFIIFLRCGNTFPDLFTLRAHKHEVHTLHKGQPADRGAYKCSFCSMTFAWKCFLDRHLVAHTNEKKFACQFCTDTFKRKDQLQIHQYKRHPEFVGPAPYTCPEPNCGVIFKCKSEMDRHQMRVHSDLRPFTCSLCPKAFKEMTQLNKHVFTSHKNVFSRELPPDPIEQTYLQ